MNNIDSHNLLKLSLFDRNKKALWTNAVTCYYIIGHEVAVNRIMFGTFMVEFWVETIRPVGSIISVEVYALRLGVLVFFRCTSRKLESTQSNKLD